MALSTKATAARSRRSTTTRRSAALAQVTCANPDVRIGTGDLALVSQAIAACRHHLLPARPEPAVRELVDVDANGLEQQTHLGEIGQLQGSLHHVVAVITV